MTDYASFRHGGTQYPLTSDTARSLLRDADPAVFYALEFFQSVIETHIGARLVATAINAEAEHVTSAVAYTMPLNPEGFLLEEHIRFPLLALYRKSATMTSIGQRRVSVDELQLVYVLPVLKGAEAEALVPVLKAVVAVLDNRITQGFDPSYTPSTPTGQPGELVWAQARAGLVKAELVAVEYGAYTPTADLYFPAALMTLRFTDRSEAVTSELAAYEGDDVVVDMKATDGTTLDSVVAGAGSVAPTVANVTPSTGSAAGGTPVTITGTGFLPNAAPRVLFDGADASNVAVVNATTLTCTTPAHAAQPTYAADVTVMNPDGQIGLLTTGFTFTTP